MRHEYYIKIVHDMETDTTLPYDMEGLPFPRHDWASINRDISDSFKRQGKKETWLRHLASIGTAIVPRNGFKPDQFTLEGYVYLFLIDGYHKIGYTKHPYDRFKNLCVPGRPRHIEFIWWHPSALDAEQRVLRMMTHKCVHGEWHTLDVNDIARIRAFLAEETRS